MTANSFVNIINGTYIGYWYSVNIEFILLLYIYIYINNWRYLYIYTIYTITKYINTYIYVYSQSTRILHIQSSIQWGRTTHKYTIILISWINFNYIISYFISSQIEDGEALLAGRRPSGQEGPFRTCSARRSTNTRRDGHENSPLPEPETRPEVGPHHNPPCSLICYNSRTS